MKRLFAIATFVAASFALTSPAHAGLLIEPYLGYGFSGKVEIAPDKEDISGLTYGARFGVTSLGFMVGAEYMGTQTKIDLPGDNTLNSTNIGIFAGYNFPILLRAYATYFFYNTAKADFAINSNSFDVEGNGLKLGVGYKGLPFVSLNLEYLMQTYKKAKIGGTNFDLNPNWKTNTLMFTVSLPFSI